jgi:hypothetical protein
MLHPYSLQHHHCKGNESINPVTTYDLRRVAGGHTIRCSPNTTIKIVFPFTN